MKEGYFYQKDKDYIVSQSRPAPLTSTLIISFTERIILVGNFVDDSGLCRIAVYDSMGDFCENGSKFGGDYYIAPASIVSFNEVPKPAQWPIRQPKRKRFFDKKRYIEQIHR